MSFSNETQEKVQQFAQEQSTRYLETAEMTYMEKLCAKAQQTRRKANGKRAA